MKAETLIRHLEQIEAQAQLLAAAVRTLKLALNDAITPRPEEPETDPEGNCLHPAAFRVSVPSMGAPARFRCGRCNTFGGIKTVQG